MNLHMHLPYQNLSNLWTGWTHNNGLHFFGWINSSKNVQDGFLAPKILIGTPYIDSIKTNFEGSCDKN